VPIFDLDAVTTALDLAGTFVFAVSGALVAVRGRLDLFGTLVLAGATGLGGGLVRDVLLGDVPPPGLVDWRFLLATVVAGGEAIASWAATSWISRVAAASVASSTANTDAVVRSSAVAGEPVVVRCAR